VGALYTPGPMVFTSGRKETPIHLGMSSPSFIAAHYHRVIQLSGTLDNDASSKGSLSFTRPTFASPGLPVWLGFPLGFSGSFARVVAEPARAGWRWS
jgi:hypothetical protein